MGLRVGDIVAIEPSLFCGHCHFCRIGRGNLCENFNSIGVGHADGGCAELVAVPATQAFVLARIVHESGSVEGSGSRGRGGWCAGPGGAS